MRLFANTGPSSAPAFIERIGAASPFTGIDLDAAFSGRPAIADLDGDHDLDAIVGGGDFSFFRSQLSDVFPDGFESGDVSAWSGAVP